MGRRVANVVLGGVWWLLEILVKGNILAYFNFFENHSPIKRVCPFKSLYKLESIIQMDFWWLFICFVMTEIKGK